MEMKQNTNHQEGCSKCVREGLVSLYNSNDTGSVAKIHYNDCKCDCHGTGIKP